MGCSWGLFQPHALPHGPQGHGAAVMYAVVTPLLNPSPAAYATAARRAPWGPRQQEASFYLVTTALGCPPECPHGVSVCPGFLCLGPTLDIPFISSWFVSLLLHPPNSYLVSIDCSVGTLLRVEGIAGNKILASVGTSSLRKNQRAHTLMSDFWSPEL